MESTPTTSAFWTIEDYADAGVMFSGARKLADSAVAPLVAQARGYMTVQDAEGAKDVASRIYSTRNARVAGNRLKTMTANGHDFLVLPWFSAGSVAREGIHATSQSTQVRPSMPLAMADGSKPKYELLPGHDSVMDLHPAVAGPWLSGSSRVLITEGVIKGDSALTAQLLSAGVTVSELAARKGTPVTVAREVLGALMERIPEVERLPILSLIGVGNWHSNPEWNSLNLRDKKVLVAFDGDLRTNRQVWAQADKIFTFLDESKNATPQLLDLGGTDATNFAAIAGYGGKLGIDDFLANVGTWDDALKLVESSLPPQPEITDIDGLEVRVGDWRINESGVAADTYRKIGIGPEAYNAWEREAVRLGGRVKTVSSLRTATDPDVEDGLAHSGTVVKSGDGEVVIEVRWENSSGEIITREVRGPEVLLSLMPAEWAKRPETVIDSLLATHPEWPPRNAKGEGWFAALKANRPGDIEYNEGWDTMGYVPSASGHPVFIVGASTLGATEKDELDNRPGVNEESLARSSFYGVKDEWHNFTGGGRDDLAGYKAQVAADILEVVDAFTDGAAFRNPAVGPVLLACGLRPTAPTSTSIQLFLSGEPGSGKSWAASFLMGFWQARPGVWNETHLPGSANDTIAASEYARMRAPIWVIDDLAPSTSRAESERQEAAIDQSIRAGFNRSGKRRSSADGKQQKVSIPRALTVYTAENQRDNLSIRQRSVDVRFERGDVINAGATRIADLTKRADNPMARLAAAMIRLWLNVDLSQTQLPMMHTIDLDGLDLNSWAGKHQLARRLIVGNQEDIKVLLEDLYKVDPSESTRRARVFSEMMFTLDVIRALGLWAGLSRKDPIMRRLAGDPADPETLMGSMLAYAAEDLKEFRAKSNSSNLVAALRNVLQAGHAHLVNPLDPGARPIPEEHYNSRALNNALGWTRDPARDTWVPRGVPIGFAGAPRGSAPDEWVALLNTTNAFDVARRHHPDLVPPGQKASASWTQVWTARGGSMIDPRYERPAGGRELTVKSRLGDGTGRLRGVPLVLAELLDGGKADLVDGWLDPSANDAA